MPATGHKIPATIKNLTDEELAQQLQQYNFTAGPIVTNTRGVYERKLFKLQTGQEAVTSTNYEPVDDDDDDDDNYQHDNSVEEEVIIQHQQPRQRTTRSLKPEIPTPPRQPPMTRQAERPPVAQSRSRTFQPQREERKSGLPLWVKLVAVLIVAVIVFLVIKNLEADPASQTPDIPDSIEINV